MTGSITPDPRFQSWLAAQVPAVPDDLLDRSMSRVLETTQDHGWTTRWSALRFAPPITAAAAVVVAVIAGGLLLANPHQVVGPPTSQRPPSPVPLTTYHLAQEFVFEYPSAWSVLSPGVDEHYNVYGPVFGTGGWQLPCGSNGCGPVSWSVPAGTVVVQFSTSVAPGPPPTVPPIVELTVGGLPYAESDSSTATVWTLYLPGKIVGSVTYPPEVWRIEARFGAGPSALARAEVADLVRSIRTEPPAPGPTSSPSPSAAPDPTDVSAARSLADHFLRAFVAEEWTTAYGLLEPQSQAAWGGSVAAFIANWPHPAKDTGGHYTIRDELYDPGEAARLGARDGQLEGADLSRSFIFDVSFPNPQGFVPGPGMLLVAAPDATGAWRLWRLG